MQRILSSEVTTCFYILEQLVANYLSEGRVWFCSEKRSQQPYKAMSKSVTMFSEERFQRPYKAMNMWKGSIPAWTSGPLSRNGCPSPPLYRSAVTGYSFLFLEYGLWLHLRKQLASIIQFVSLTTLLFVPHLLLQSGKVVSSKCKKKKRKKKDSNVTW